MASTEFETRDSLERRLSFDRLFRRLAHAFEGNREVVRKCYEPLLPSFSAGDRVLDLGCGSGVFLEELGKRGIYGVGVDIDPERAAECAGKGLKVYERSLDEFISEFCEPVDGVLLMHIVEHMEGEEAFRLLFRSVQLLRPKGKVIIVTPNYSHGMVSAETFWLDISHKRPYPLALLRTMIETLGLQVIEARVAPWNQIDLLVVGCKQS